MFFSEMAHPTRDRRGHHRRDCLGWCCCQTPRWKLCHRASEHRPQPLQSLAVIWLQMCFHDVFGNNIRIARPDQPIPNRDPSPESWNQNQHRPVARPLGLWEDAGNKEGIHVYFAGRESGFSVE